MKNLHRGNPEYHRVPQSKYSLWLSVLLCGSLCNKKSYNKSHLVQMAFIINEPVNWLVVPLLLQIPLQLISCRNCTSILNFPRQP